METPFTLGTTYYKATMQASQVKRTCEICNGNLVVKVTTGDGKEWLVSCDACGLGFEGPRGYTMEHEWVAQATPFTPVSVHSFHNGDHWYLTDSWGNQCSWSDLYPTYDEALAASAKRAAEMIEENHRRRASSKQSMLKKKTWTVQYHAKCIKDLERSLEWHRSKIQLIKG